MKNLLSIHNLSREEIESIIKKTNEIKKETKIFSESLQSKTLALAFFEPSTRTRIGFSVAIQKLGGNVVELTEAKFKNNMSSPETTEDTLRILGDYTDLIVLRHPSKDLMEKLDFKSKIINAGNGDDEHPTQTLIDLYAIQKHFGHIDGLKIAIIGDLYNMRTAHSLVRGLSKFDNIALELISPRSLSLSKKYLENKNHEETDLMNLKDRDVIYMTGFAPDKENPETNEENRLKYQLNSKTIETIKENAIILCPLPRVDEITQYIDQQKQAKYFEQSADGVYVRMAILLSMFDN